MHRTSFEEIVRSPGRIPDRKVARRLDRRALATTIPFSTLSEL